MSNSTELYCTDCNREFEKFEDVTMVCGGVVEPFLDDRAFHVAAGDDPSYRTLCKRCAVLLVEPRPPISNLIKAVQMEREIARHLIVDDPHPQIMAEWKEAMAYTDSLLHKRPQQRPNRVLVKIDGQNRISVHAERPGEIFVFVHHHFHKVSLGPDSIAKLCAIKEEA